MESNLDANFLGMVTSQMVLDHLVKKLPTSAFCCFSGEVARLVKKDHDHRRKTQENDNDNPEPKFYPRNYGDCNPS